MNNKKFLIISVLVAIVGFTALSFYNSNSKSNRNEAVDSDVLIKPHSPSKGIATAPVTIVEFLDPECESCRAMHPIVQNLLKEYEGKVRLVIRYMPFHRNSMFVSTALEEAKEQGKFEEALNILFENQPIWGDHHNPRPELIPGYLEAVGIPKQTLDPGALLSKHQSKIEIDRKDGELLGISSTPTFFVNGVKLETIGYEPIKQAIEKALKEL